VPGGRDGELRREFGCDGLVPRQQRGHDACGPGGITFEPVLGKGADSRCSHAGARQHRARPWGGSLGGVRPKVAADLPASGEFQQLQDILIGGVTPAGQVPSVVKLSPPDDEGGGAVEFAFWKMAGDAGIRIPHACLVLDGERRHFASARFDRHLRPDGSWGRRHVHTLSGFLHRRTSDGQIDYEDFIRLARALGGIGEARECFRRAVFNLLTTNRDDHGRNHAFLYHEADRTWTLSPAYDLNPNVANVLIALTWLGRAEIPTRFDQLTQLAEIGGITPRSAKSIYEEVEAATLGGWRAVAARAGVPENIAGRWEKEMIQQTKLLREDAHRPSATAKTRVAAPKRSPRA
jgi:serine/threonine-protein kinase HipA